MYDYETFKERYKDMLRENMPMFPIRDTQIRKVNENMDGISIKLQETGAQPVLYLDGRYEEYRSGMSLEEIFLRDLQFLAQLSKALPNVPNLTKESVKDHVYAEVIHGDKNRELLKDVPHRKMEDLAVIPRYRISEEASFIVSNAVLSEVKLTQEEVLEAAMMNTARMDYTFMLLNQHIMRILSEQEAPEDYIKQYMEESTPDIYVLTSKSGIYGASEIALPQRLKEIHEQLGEGFYILPSSIHEVLIVPESWMENCGSSRNELEQIVREVNQTVVSSGDFLSDSLYCYDGRKLMIAGEHMKLSEDVKKIGRSR